MIRTVARRATASFAVRGSEFLGRAAPASDPDAAESFVARVREAYDDATHNVPAYRVAADGVGTETARTENGLVREYADDDGEPSGSAGDPALNVLRQRELRDVVVVVTRYYGGTNLGVGGLARAYGRATKEAVDAASVVEREPRERFTVRVAYDDSGTVRGVLESGPGEFDAAYDERVTFTVRVPADQAAAVRDRLRSVTSDRVSFG